MKDMTSKIHDSLKFIKDLNDYSQSLTAEFPEWFNKIRRQNLLRVNESGIPTIKDEEWKYTNLSPIRESCFSLNVKPSSVDEKQFSKYVSKEDINLVLINGVIDEDLSSKQTLPKGLKIVKLNEAIQKGDEDIKRLLNKYEKEETPFIALNQALANDGIFISVEKNCVIEPLIHVVHITSFSKGELFHTPRTLLTLGSSSEATLLESHIAFSDSLSYLSNALSDIFLDKNSTLHYCKAQSESLKSYHIGATRVWQERDSDFDGFSLMVGAKMTRNDLHLVLNDEGSNATLNGLYCINGRQLADNHTSVDHRQPNCTSTQLYKGILNGDSHAVFNGKIFVQPIAQLTNSYQLNRNLVLGNDCRVDTKPQLEIFADDVKCTHGATIGRLNEDEIFYLQTRCIPKKKAVRILAHGFVDEIINTIKNASIHTKLNHLLQPTFTALE